MEANTTPGIKYLSGNFIRLFLSPTKFFSDVAAIKSFSLIAVSSFLFALSEGFTRIEHKVLRYNLLDGPTDQEKLINVLVADWLLMWAMLLGMAALFAYFVWLIGGWFFNVRLRWSGIKQIDKELGRAIYLAANMVYAIPMTLVMIVATFRYQNYLYYYDNDLYLSLVPTVFFVWSLLTTYKAIKANFPAKNWLLLVWFVFLPILFNISLLFLFAFAGTYL